MVTAIALRFGRKTFMSQFKAALVLIVLAFGASSIHAQNVNDMVKWTSAQVVHYDVVAEYSGNTNVLLASGYATSYATQVKDRFEVGFDWNPLEMTMVRSPCSRTFPR